MPHARKHTQTHTDAGRHTQTDTDAGRHTQTHIDTLTHTTHTQGNGSHLPGGI